MKELKVIPIAAGSVMDTFGIFTKSYENVTTWFNNKRKKRQIASTKVIVRC